MLIHNPHRFSEYDLIIDARSEPEYEEDHIPNAINLPVVHYEQYAEVGTLHKIDRYRAYQIGVAYSLKNIARHIDQVISSYSVTTRILIYCFRGGKRSRLWFDALDTIGYHAEKFPGGWKAYRRWVNEQLSLVPQQFQFNVLCGPTGCGKTRLLSALRAAGAQVLDLENIASHRGSLIGAIPGIEQPSQKYFESLILKELLTFETDKPVWVEAESKKIGALQIPGALFTAMHQGNCFTLEAPMSERVKVWREDYRHFEENPAWMLERLKHLIPLIGRKEFSEWEIMASQQRMPELFERLMYNHYDPAYNRSISKHYPQINDGARLKSTSLDPQYLMTIAAQLCGN